MNIKHSSHSAQSNILTRKTPRHGTLPLPGRVVPISVYRWVSGALGNGGLSRVDDAADRVSRRGERFDRGFDSGLLAFEVIDLSLIHI